MRYVCVLLSLSFVVGLSFGQDAPGPDEPPVKTVHRYVEAWCGSGGFGSVTIGYGSGADHDAACHAALDDAKLDPTIANCTDDDLGWQCYVPMFRVDRPVEEQEIVAADGEWLVRYSCRCVDDVTVKGFARADDYCTALEEARRKALIGAARHCGAVYCWCCVLECPDDGP